MLEERPPAFVPCKRIGPHTLVLCTRTLFQWEFENNGPQNEVKSWQITNKHWELGKNRILEGPLLSIACILDMWEMPKDTGQTWCILSYACAVSVTWKTKICLVEPRTCLLNDPVVILGSPYLKLNMLFLCTLLYCLSHWLAPYLPDHSIQEHKSLIYPHINHQ